MSAMPRYDNRLHVVLALALLLACLAGCGGQPMSFPTPESEMGDRPGLFTGEKGAWDLLSRDASSTPTR
jgi:hypothetical protein